MLAKQITHITAPKRGGQVNDIVMPACMDCIYWGKDWVQDLSKICLHPDNLPNNDDDLQQFLVVGMMHSCDKFKRA